MQPIFLYDRAKVLYNRSMNLTVHPLTPDLWPALEDLFGENWPVSRCWCMYWRIGSEYRKRPGEENKAAFGELVKRGPPPGLLAFEGELAVVVDLQGSPQESGGDSAAITYNVGCEEINCFLGEDMKILEWVIAVLKTTPARWQSLAETLPVDLTREQPLPGEWSAVECLQHIVDTEQIFTQRVEAFLAGEDFAAFNPDTEGSQTGEKTLADLAGEFARQRESSLRRLASLQPQDLDRRVRHQALGMVSLNEMLHEWAAHDLMHTVQAERAMMQPFIRCSGPWQKYFVDHIAEPKA